MRESNTSTTPKIEDVRYILFLLDTKSKEHDGMIYCSYREAREYAIECIKDKYADKAIVGMFVLDQHARGMGITLVETIGFVGDKKNVTQLQLFK